MTTTTISSNPRNMKAFWTVCVTLLVSKSLYPISSYLFFSPLLCDRGTTVTISLLTSPQRPGHFNHLQRLWHFTRPQRLVHHTHPQRPGHHCHPQRPGHFYAAKSRNAKSNVVIPRLSQRLPHVSGYTQRLPMACRAVSTWLSFRSAYTLPARSAYI